MIDPGNNSRQILWLNGRFVPLQEAAISPLDRGFLFGDGVFETLRGQYGHPLYVEDHVERLKRSLYDLRIRLETRPDWEPLLNELLQRNELLADVARIKIIVTRGVQQGLGLPEGKSPTVCVSAHKYQPPDDATYREGWRLEVYRDGFSPPLAKHKSLNYLYFMTARQAAMDASTNEAVILDPYGKVTETSAGSLIARTDGGWWTPVSAYQLPGTTLGRVADVLRTRGKQVEKRTSSVDDLLAAETIWVLNSLLGIMPVCAIAGRAVIDLAAEEATLLREELFQLG